MGADSATGTGGVQTQTQKRGKREKKERFLSAQADPSQEAKGKKKSACSVRNDGWVPAVDPGRRQKPERFATLVYRSERKKKPACSVRNDG
jgi:hypothetical protein